MKHIALTALFAASLAAQTEPSKAEARALLELAPVIAVEEQEKDLVKAQALYRSAMQDQKLSVMARGLARQRLAALLVRLGKERDAKQVLAAGKGAVVSLDDVTNGQLNRQDPEREKKLRMQARELLKKTNARRDSNFGPNLTEQLNWIGEPALLEVVLHMEGLIDKGKPGAYPDELCGFLWRRGGPLASAMLVKVAGARHLSRSAAVAARYTKRLDVNSPEARAFFEHENWRVALAFLNSVVQSLDGAELLTLADRGGVEMKTYVLNVLPRRELDGAQRQRAHAMCREAITGTSPEYGKSAQHFLCSSQSQQSMEGMQMLFEMLPDLHRRDIPVNTFHLSRPNAPGPREFSSDEVAALLPLMRAAVDEIGPLDSGERADSSATQWLQQLVYTCILNDRSSDASAELALVMWDIGYDVHHVFASVKSPGLAKKMLERWHKVPSQNQRSFLGGMMQLSLPADTLPILRGIADDLLSGRSSSTKRDAFKSVVALVGKTGRDEAADWLLERWRNSAGQPRYSVRTRSPMVTALMELGRQNRSKRVRDAMCEMIRGTGGAQILTESRASLLLAVLSMGDARGLDFVADGVSTKSEMHPYDDSERVRKVTPLQYVMFKDPQPAHGFSKQQIADTVRRYAQRVSGNGVLDPGRMVTSRLSDEVLCILANEELSGYPLNWAQTLLRRLNGRIVKGEDCTVLERCYLDALGKKGRSGRWSIDGLDALVERYRDRIAALIDGEDGYWARAAVRLLGDDKDLVDVAKLLGSKHRLVREWASEEVLSGGAKVDSERLIPLLADTSLRVRGNIASHLGAMVDEKAVPGLIAMLRDPDQGARDIAANALTRIRFYHEQQAHWDRVLKGMDASPASAAEKLLVQAKPGAKKDQRLLAIKSLGVLGAPEALPFLIDWTNDADKDVQAASRAAITQIHLNPRK